MTGPDRPAVARRVAFEGLQYHAAAYSRYRPFVELFMAWIFDGGEYPTCYFSPFIGRSVDELVMEGLEHAYGEGELRRQIPLGLMERLALLRSHIKPT